MAKTEKLMEAAKVHLNTDEKMVAVIKGTYIGKIISSKTPRNGIFIATSKRIVFFTFKTFGGFDLEFFPYNDISSLEMSKGIVSYTISFFSSGNKVTIKNVIEQDARLKGVAGFVEFVSSQIGNMPQKTVTEIEPEDKQDTLEADEAETQSATIQKNQVAGNMEKKVWYNNKATVIVLLIIFFPIGIYGLWKGSAFKVTGKLIWTAFIVCFLAFGFQSDDGQSDKLVSQSKETTKVASIKQQAPQMSIPEIIDEVVALLREGRKMENYRQKDIGTACNMMRELQPRAKAVRDAADLVKDMNYFDLGCAAIEVYNCVACAKDAMGACDRVSRYLLLQRERMKVGTDEELDLPGVEKFKRKVGLIGYHEIGYYSLAEAVQEIVSGAMDYGDVLDLLIEDTGVDEINLVKTVDNFLIYSWETHYNFYQIAVYKNDNDFYPSGSPLKEGYYAFTGTQTFHHALGGTVDMLCFKKISVN